MGSGTTVELVLGAIFPPLIDVVNRYIKHSRIRYIVSIVLCVLAGLGVTLFEGTLTAGNILESTAVVATAAATVYKLYWNKSKARTYVVPEKTLKMREGEEGV